MKENNDGDEAIMLEPASLSDIPTLQDLYNENSRRKFIEFIPDEEDKNNKLILIRSEPGSGLIFKEKDNLIRLESAETVEEENIGSLCIKSQKISSWWNKVKYSEKIRNLPIVFADDEEVICRLYSRLFKIYFNQVYVFQNSIDAIETINRIKPALVITDMRKPDMSGLDLANIIRSNRSLSKTLILLCSGHAFSLKDYKPGLFCRLIRKPFSCNKIIKSALFYLAVNNEP